MKDFFQNEDRAAYLTLIVGVFVFSLTFSVTLFLIKYKLDAGSQERCEAAGGVIIKGGACVDPSIVRPVPTKKES